MDSCFRRNDIVSVSGMTGTLSPVIPECGGAAYPESIVDTKVLGFTMDPCLRRGDVLSMDSRSPIRSRTGLPGPA